MGCYGPLWLAHTLDSSIDFCDTLAHNSGMDWDHLRFVLALARAGSVRAAADTLDVTRSTVSRRITAFEKQLGVRLFERLPSGYVPTPAGEAILASALQLEEEIFRLERQVHGQDTRLTGELRVTLTRQLVDLLMPDLVAFTKIFPGIEVGLIASPEMLNLTKREADVAIRATDRPPDHLVGRHLFAYTSAIYASVAYLAEHDVTATPPILNWVGWTERTPFPEWVKASPYPLVPARHQMTDVMLLFEAVKAGLGMGILPCYLADREPTICRVPPGSIRPGREIWLLTHTDLRHTARVRAFFDHMAQAITAHRALIEGHRPWQPEPDTEQGNGK